MKNAQDDDVIMSRAHSLELFLWLWRAILLATCFGLFHMAIRVWLRLPIAVFTKANKRRVQIAQQFHYYDYQIEAGKTFVHNSIHSTNENGGARKMNESVWIECEKSALLAIHLCEGKNRQRARERVARSRVRGCVWVCADCVYNYIHKINLWFY